KMGGGFDLTANTTVCLTAGKAMQVGDFDGDTKPDVAVMANAQVQICRGDGKGKFSAAAADRASFDFSGDISIPTLYSSRGVAGRKKLAATNYGAIYVFDDIQASAPVNSVKVTGDLKLMVVGLADFSNDGVEELLMGTWDGGSYYELRVMSRVGNA